jgi:LPXTG-site transpeptidase (sortase) family protein
MLLLIAAVSGLYTGGVLATASYNRYAARGDTDVLPPAPILASTQNEPPAFIPEVPADNPAAPALPLTVFPSALSPGTTVPDTLAADTTAAAAVVRDPVATPNPLPRPSPGPSQITRLVIPSIVLDSKVVEVGWVVREDQGRQRREWQVAEYAVGHHQGSGNPGDGTNIVLAGHVGGLGYVFRDLYYVKPGETVVIYTGGQQHEYVIAERLVVDEIGVSSEQRAQNARLIAPTPDEQITMVTCWPPTGPTRFTQRVIVHAVPASTTGK